MDNNNTERGQGRPMKSITVGIIGILVLLAGIGTWWLTADTLNETASFCTFVAKNPIQGSCYSYCSGLNCVVTSTNSLGGFARPLGWFFALIVLLGFVLVIIALRSKQEAPATTK